ncbi:MAG: PHB depolymerase family esterase [Micromonosporaceae bacterium]|nr:PHB depolymerase family esterase [Micromonosporaceae bacterium]
MKRHTFKVLVAAVVMPIVAMMVVLLSGRPAAAATLTRVTNFGNNPSNLNMYIYVPDRVAARPALLVAIHYCTGTASALFSGYFHDFVTAADQFGYIIVFPEATRSGQCFDVYSPQALTRNGGSDPVGIISMVNYAKANFNVDPNRVYVAGVSSGAMMTNVMAAEYPDVFKAGSAYMGVPATCFATGSSTNTWNSQCAGGQITKTAQQWGDAARAMFPGYTGAYPRMQLFHGTSDSTLNYVNFGEEIKQWTNLDGVSQNAVQTDSPFASTTRTRYGNTTAQPPVEAYSVAGAGHELPRTGMVAFAITFLGLNQGSTGGPSSQPPPPPSSNPPASIPPPPPGGCTATYSIVNQWQGGFQANVNVTNGSSARSAWQVGWTFANGQTITQLWNGTLSQSGSSVTVRNVSYNGTLGAGQSTSFGFTGTWNGTNSAPALSCQ